MYHVDDYINFLHCLSSAWALEVMHCLFFCYNFAHSSISHEISHIFAYFTKNGSSSIQWYHDWSQFSVLTVPPGRSYARLFGLSVPPNIELELSLSFSLSSQQHTTHCTIHRGLMKYLHITIMAVSLILLLWVICCACDIEGDRLYLLQKG